MPGCWAADNGGVRSVAEHQQAVRELIRARPAVAVSLIAAQGLALADDVVARMSLPVFDNSAMDGYAVRAEDTSGATPADRAAFHHLVARVCARTRLRSSSG